MKLGPNHRDGCIGEPYRYSGEGYNRVRICGCGAEDHAPVIDEPKILNLMDALRRSVAEAEAKRAQKEEP